MSDKALLENVCPSPTVDLVRAVCDLYPDYRPSAAITMAREAKLITLGEELAMQRLLIDARATS